jgi:hypothetical protein
MVPFTATSVGRSLEAEPGRDALFDFGRRFGLAGFDSFTCHASESVLIPSSRRSAADRLEESLRAGLARRVLTLLLRACPLEARPGLANLSKTVGFDLFTVSPAPKSELALGGEARWLDPCLLRAALLDLERARERGLDVVVVDVLAVVAVYTLSLYMLSAADVTLSVSDGPYLSWPSDRAL